MYSDVVLLTCSFQVHLRHVFGEFTGAGHCFTLPCDVGHCVPATCAITVDEVRVRRLHVHHLSMTSALITPARGRRGRCQTANKSPCWPVGGGTTASCWPSTSVESTWDRNTTMLSCEDEQCRVSGQKGGTSEALLQPEWLTAVRHLIKRRMGVNNFHYYFRAAINGTTDICANCLS